MWKVRMGWKVPEVDRAPRKVMEFHVEVRSNQYKGADEKG
jgi:hypothetical protein